MEFIIETDESHAGQVIPASAGKTKSQKNLDKLQELNKDILLLTKEIESKYPELYKHLNETPVNYSSDSNFEVTIMELENYLESLDTQLYNYFDTHELNAKLFNN